MDFNEVFYRDPYQQEYQVQILKLEALCEADRGSYQDLDQVYVAEIEPACFYPGGGGQAPDRGRIAEAKVLDVRERGGRIEVLLDRPLELKRSYRAEIDLQRRLKFMRQHSGEHLISGLAHSHYQAENLGFHMNQSYFTLDLDRILTEVELLELERLANQEILENRAISSRVGHVSEFEASAYRSKKDFDSLIRLIDIEHCDSCACCALQCRSTAEIGCLRLIRSERIRSGQRLTWLQGMEALHFDRENRQLIEQLSRLFSLPREGLESTISALKSSEEVAWRERDQSLLRVYQFELEHLISQKHAAHQDSYRILWPQKELRLFKRVAHKFIESCAKEYELVFLLLRPAGEEIYDFILAGPEERLAQDLSYLGSQHDYRGGGQGSLYRGRFAKSSLEELSIDLELPRLK
ncbi:MAG: hypothetical protein Q4P72_02875 [Eubacteriales bacterium]|nr:hypothetical protein [Eubacteriales bacterium]